METKRIWSHPLLASLWEGLPAGKTGGLPRILITQAQIAPGWYPPPAEWFQQTRRGGYPDGEDDPTARVHRGHDTP